MKEKCSRVFITGVGAVSPVGIGAKPTFDALCRGENGIREISAWKASGFPVTYGGIIPQINELFEKEKDIAKYRSRKAVYAAVALREALEQSNNSVRQGKGGVFLGIETGRIDIHKLFDMFTKAGSPKGLDLNAFGKNCFHYLTAEEALSKQPFFISNLVAHIAGIQGESRGVSNACSSANQAIGEAFRKIATGEIDWAITGGSDDMIDEYMAIGFHLLGALSRGFPPDNSSRPFDITRRGFVLGEGAGILILESEKHANAHGSKPLATLTAYGSSTSAGKITETNWDGIFQTMSAALDEGGVAKDEIDYINAHGTGTPMNDPSESEAIRRLFGERAAKIPISSTKSMIGHLIAASGAVEAVVSTMSVAEGRIHPTRNLTKVDPACGLDFVPEGSRNINIRNALSNSLGFAGINSTLLFSHPD